MTEQKNRRTRAAHNLSRADKKAVEPENQAANVQPVRSCSIFEQSDATKATMLERNSSVNRHRVSVRI